MFKNLKIGARLTLVFGLIFVLLCVSTKTDADPGFTPPDLADHTIYSTYKFDNTDKVVNIGTQPLFVPIGLITETMKRDLILRDAFKARGVELHFFPFLKGYDLNFFLKRGDLDGGVGGDMPTLTIVNKMDIIVAARIQSGFLSIMTDQYMTINELRGKRIAFPYGSNAHYALLNILDFSGLDESQVDLIHMEVSDMIEALTKGKIDAFISWEPIPAMAAERDPDKVVIHRSLTSAYLYFDKYFCDTNSEISSLVLASEIRALKWMKYDRQNLLSASRWAIDAYNKLSIQPMNLTPEDIAKLAIEDIVGSAFPPVISKKELEDGSRLFYEFALLKKFGMISASSKWAKVLKSFDREMLKRVISNAEALRLDEFHYDMSEGMDE